MQELSATTVQALIDGPHRVKMLATELLLRRREVERLRRDLKRRELLVSLAVANERVEVLSPEGSKPKPVWGNADARTAETQRRLDADPDAAALRARIEAAEEVADRLAIDLAYEQDMFKGARAVALILGGERA